MVSPARTTPHNRVLGLFARNKALTVVFFTSVAVIVAVAIVAAPPLISALQGRTLGVAAHADTPTRQTTISTDHLPAYTPLPVARIAALPVADYAAALPGLLPATTKTVGAPTQTATITASAPLYGDGAKEPVARLQPNDFTGTPTVVSVVKTVGEWALVLTPARQLLPSEDVDHHAAAQTAAWMPKTYLKGLSAVTAKVTLSVGKQEMTVSQDGKADQTFQVAVGTTTDPTPAGVTGYLEQRYVDAANGTGTTPIQLTSLHSATVDNPVKGTTGGLIALHYYPTNTGAISHGCIRLTREGLAAVGALPLGTPVTITR